MKILVWTQVATQAFAKVLCPYFHELVVGVGFSPKNVLTSLSIDQRRSPGGLQAFASGQEHGGLPSLGHLGYLAVATLPNCLPIRDLTLSL